MITTIGDTHGKHQGMVEITNMHHNGKMQIDIIQNICNYNVKIKTESETLT